jgi:hypothetical protein
MATKFVFPKSPKVGDRIEIVSISESKLPINIVGNSEAGKNLILIFPDETKSGNADGEEVIATINENNIVYTFKCVTAQNSHTWLLEGTCLYPIISEIKTRLTDVEEGLEFVSELSDIEAIDAKLSDFTSEISGMNETVEGFSSGIEGINEKLSAYDQDIDDLFAAIASLTSSLAEVAALAAAPTRRR